MIFKNKKTIILCAASFVLGCIFKNENILSKSIKVNNLEHVLNNIKVDDIATKVLENNNNYKKFCDIEDNFYLCSENFLDYYETDTLTIANEIIKRSESVESDSSMVPLRENFADELESAISNSWDKCSPQKIDSFYHLLNEIKVVEVDNISTEFDAVGEYEDENKIIKIDVNKIKKHNDVNNEENIDENYFDYEISDVLKHEMNHVLQDTCSCDKNNYKFCFGNKTLWEANAEINTGDINTYFRECEIYNLIKMIGILNDSVKEKSFNYLLIDNNVKELFAYFNAKTEEEKKSVYNFLNYVNLYSIDYNDKNVSSKISLQLLKYYCTNLMNFIESKNISLEESIYLFKFYLNDVLDFLNYKNDDEFYIKTKEIVESFIFYLSNIYNVNESTVQKKLHSVSVYHYVDNNNSDNNDKVTGIIPANVVEALNKSDSNKVDFLYEQLELAGIDFFTPCSSDQYLYFANFKFADEFFNYIDTVSSYTYKKKN